MWSHDDEEKQGKHERRKRKQQSTKQGGRRSSNKGKQPQKNRLCTIKRNTERETKEKHRHRSETVVRSWSKRSSFSPAGFPFNIVSFHSLFPSFVLARTASLPPVVSAMCLHTKISAPMPMMETRTRSHLNRSVVAKISPASHVDREPNNTNTSRLPYWGWGRSIASACSRPAWREIAQPPSSKLRSFKNASRFPEHSQEKTNNEQVMKGENKAEKMSHEFYQKDHQAPPLFLCAWQQGQRWDNGFWSKKDR